MSFDTNQSKCMPTWLFGWFSKIDTNNLFFLGLLEAAARYLISRDEPLCVQFKISALTAAHLSLVAIVFAQLFKITYQTSFMQFSLYEGLVPNTCSLEYEPFAEIKIK